MSVAYSSPFPVGVFFTMIHLDISGYVDNHEHGFAMIAKDFREERRRPV